MAVCLITAPTVSEFSDPAELRSESVQHSAKNPQLGILSLAAVLETRGECLYIVDLNRAYINYASSVSRYVSDDFVEIAACTIASNDCEVYGFSTICSSYPLTLRIAKATKAIRPQSAILLGGPQASVVDVLTLAAFPFIDFVLRGESENTLPLLLDQLRGSSGFDRVSGLTFRSGSRPQRNCNPPVIQDLDSIPPPAYHLTQYLDGATRASLELGRGCPFSCTFCSTNDFFRRKFRLRSPRRVLRDMKSLAETYSIRDFELVHDMFTVDRRRVQIFCEAMIASGEGFTWSCSARTDCIDEQLLELMAQAGCTGIFYGVEVGSEKMQTIIDKDLDTRRAHVVIDATERFGISSTVSLICGFPEETWQDVRESMNFFMHAARCPRSHPQLNLLAPLAETPVFSKHKHELILEELCSCVSHQAQSQDRADMEMIAAYPDIFPNFYLIPTPQLDRKCLFELREFTLMGLARFRWLMVAIDQSTSGLFDFFLSWREHRLRRHPYSGASQLRQYYRTDCFREDFLSFLRTHRVCKRTTVRALVEYEDAVRGNRSNCDLGATSTDLLDHETAPCPTDIPTRKNHLVVLELRHDIQNVIEALKIGEKPFASTGRYYYITRPISPTVTQLEKISDWMARLLRSCDGKHTVQDITRRMCAHLPEVQKCLRKYVCLRMLEGARKKGLINIFREAHGNPGLI